MEQTGQEVPRLSSEDGESLRRARTGADESELQADTSGKLGERYPKLTVVVLVQDSISGRMESVRISLSKMQLEAFGSGAIVAAAQSGAAKLVNQENFNKMLSRFDPLWQGVIGENPANVLRGS